MFIPIWLIMVMQLVTSIIYYVLGADAAITKRKEEIIRKMAEREVIELTAKAIIAEFKKRIDKKDAQKIDRRSLDN